MLNAQEARVFLRKAYREVNHRFQLAGSDLDDFYDIRRLFEAYTIQFTKNGSLFTVDRYGDIITLYNNGILLNNLVLDRFLWFHLKKEREENKRVAELRKRFAEDTKRILFNELPEFSSSD